MKLKRLVVNIVLFSLIFVQSAWADFDPTAQMKSFMEDISKKMAEMQKTIEQQNKTIEQQNAKIQGLESRELPIQAVPQAKAEKPKSFQENLKHYVFGKAESLPKSEEKQSVKVGMGSMELGALLQEWYTFTDQKAKSNFRNRRVELGFSGRLTDHLKWASVIDPSLVREDNSTRSILKDVYVAYDGIPHHEIKLGQFKIPVTEEGFRSSALIDTIERSFIGTQFGDKRDIGIMGLGKWKYLDYQVGVFNGTELNSFDKNDQKDIAARVVLKPFQDNLLLKGLEGGTSMYYSVPNHNSANSEKKRIGFEARYEYKNLSIKSEYMMGQDGTTLVNGWYIQGGYFILPRWQPVIRFEGFNPNERLSSSHEFDTTIGLNYFFVYPKTKLQFNYVHKDTAGVNGTSDNQLITAVQYAF